jgi:hypothetical protein
MPLSEEDDYNYRNGYYFEMDPESTGAAYLYLRFEMLKLNVPSSVQLLIDEISFWGAYADD